MRLRILTVAMFAVGMFGVCVGPLVTEITPWWFEVGWYAMAGAIGFVGLVRFLMPRRPSPYPSWLTPEIRQRVGESVWQYWRRALREGRGDTGLKIIVGIGVSRWLESQRIRAERELTRMGVHHV